MRSLSSLRSNVLRIGTVALCGCVLSWYCPNRVQAAAGQLDLSFGSGGKVTTDFLDGTDLAYSLATQPDGKIVAAGFTFSNSSAGDFAVARYNADGSLDPSFGDGGRLSIDFSGIGSQDSGSSVALQPDGKIVLGGYTTFFGFAFALIRLNSDGSLDPTFGVGGKVRTDFSPFDAFVNAIALQPDGKIVAVGSRTPLTRGQPRSDFAVARYNVDGSLDTTFGSGGKVTTDFLQLDDFATAVAIQPDGKIIAVGSNDVTTFAQFLWDFAIARYNADGSLDSSFGAGGKVTTNFFGGFDQAHAIVIQPDGRLVVGGEANNSSMSALTDFGLARYNLDGSLDVTFGTGGKAIPTGVSGFDTATALALRPDGKIIAAGIAEDINERTDFALAQYNTNGTLDASFGSGGRVRTDFLGFDDGANAVALQNDGKIIAAGRANADFIHGVFALARYDGVTFDTCLQDDSNGNLLEFNSLTGDYQFTNCRGLKLGGKGRVTRRGNIITLEQNGPDRRLLARIDGSVHKATASLQVFSQGATFTVADHNTLNNTCSCGAQLVGAMGADG